MRQARLRHGEEREAREEPGRRENGHRLGSAPSGSHARLTEPRDNGLRQKGAPGEEAQEEHGDVEEGRPARPGHGSEDAPERLAARPRRVVPAVEPEHDRIPRRGDQETQGEPAKRPRLPPGLAKAAREREVGEHAPERDQESHRALRERREPGGDPGRRVPASPGRRAPPAPHERVARDGGPERQGRVGQRHAADRDELHGQEEHERRAPGDVSSEGPAGEGMLNQDEEERGDRGREPRRRLADPQDGVCRRGEPVDEGGLGEARRPAEGGRDPGALGQHLPRGLGVGALVPVGESHGAQADEEEQPCEQEEQQGVPGREHGLDCTRDS